MVDLIEMLKGLIHDPNSNGILVLIFIVLGALIPFILPILLGEE
ncbi:MAG TPA: hypothetical protein PLR34_05525 [Bacteroidales bacterium]|nr:hypothetical protein [Bacteroidales bacterium]